MNPSKEIQRKAEKAIDRAIITQSRVTPEEESYIAKHAISAYEYACAIIQGRWKPGEKAIAQNGGVSILYAKTVVKGRFVRGEKAIAKDPGWSLDYVELFPETRAKFEPSIAQDAEIAVEYATEVLKGRFELGEPVIAKDPYWSEVYNNRLNNVLFNYRQKLKAVSIG